MHRLAVPVQIPAKEQESALAKLQKSSVLKYVSVEQKESQISYQMPHQPSLADQFTTVEVRNMEELTALLVHH